MKIDRITLTLTNLFTIPTTSNFPAIPLFYDNMYLFRVYNGTSSSFVDIDSRRMDPQAFRCISFDHIFDQASYQMMYTNSKDGAVFTMAYKGSGSDVYTRRIRESHTDDVPCFFL